MQKVRYIILFVVTFFLFAIKAEAVNDIKINNQTLSPLFNKNIYVYNYFINKDVNEINIVCDKEDNETITNDGLFSIDSSETKIILSSSLNNKKYIVNIYKESNSNEIISPLLKSLVIDNYNIDFNDNKFTYDVYIDKEERLNIDYEVYHPSLKVIYNGNDNLSKNKNVITIKVMTKDEKISNIYTINAYKTISGFKEKENTTSNNINTSLVAILIFFIDLFLVSFMTYFFYFKKIRIHT